MQIARLAQQVERVNGNQPLDARLTRVEMFEMADGSQRDAVMIYFQNDNEEYQIRVTAPAPSTAPAWAVRDWTEELFASDGF